MSAIAHAHSRTGEIRLQLGDAAPVALTRDEVEELAVQVIQALVDQAQILEKVKS